MEETTVEIRRICKMRMTKKKILPLLLGGYGYAGRGVVERHGVRGRRRYSSVCVEEKDEIERM